MLVVKRILPYLEVGWQHFRRKYKFSQLHKIFGFWLVCCKGQHGVLMIAKLYDWRYIGCSEKEEFLFYPPPPRRRWGAVAYIFFLKFMDGGCLKTWHKIMKSCLSVLYLLLPSIWQHLFFV